jgi:hypothetical protein
LKDYFHQQLKRAVQVGDAKVVMLEPSVITRVKEIAQEVAKVAMLEPNVITRVKEIAQEVAKVAMLEPNVITRVKVMVITKEDVKVVDTEEACVDAKKKRVDVNEC